VSLYPANLSRVEQEVFDRNNQEQLEERMNIYVGNLAFQVTEDDLRKAFEQYGQTASVNVIKDKFTGESRGFGFVEMPGKTEGEAAIKALDGTDLGGRPIRVNEARPRENRGGGFRGGNGGRGRRF
jgi:RNA recognition motif-containing protein